MTASVHDVNKFYLPWQMVRLRAKQLHQVKDKLFLVVEYLDGEDSFQNYVRVKNWAEMLKVAYAEGSDARKLIQEVCDRLQYERNDGLYSVWASEESKRLDFEYYWQDATTARMLLELRKDLQRRKYAFQFKGKPKAHVEFVCELEKFLVSKGAI